MRARLLLLASVLLVLGTASGCGPGCQDACQASLTCRAQLEGAPVPTESEINLCADACDRDPVCADKDAAIECLASVTCEDPAAAAAKLAECDRICCDGPSCPIP